MPNERGQIFRFLKHSGVYAIGNVLDRAAAFILLPLYTNYLSPSQYGALELFYVVSAAFSGILSVGMAHATLRFYFEYETDTDRNSVVTTNLIASLLITTAGAMIVGYWRGKLGFAVFGNDGYSNGITIILITMVLELSSQVCIAYLRARELSLLFVLLSLAKLVVQCAANTYMVVYRSAGVEGVLLGNLLAVGAGWLILIVITVRNCGFRFELDKAIPCLKYSFPFLLSTLTALVSSNIDRVLITRYRSLSLLGTFALATKFSGLLFFFIGEPFNRSYGAFRFSIMKDPDAGTIHSRVVRYLFIASLTVGLGVALFAGELLRLMSNPEYWASVEVLPLLLIASIFQILSYPLQTGMLYGKHTRYHFYINLLLAAVSVTFNFLLIPRIGVIGACLTQLLCAALGAFMNDRISQRYFRVKYEWLAMCSAGGAAVLAYLFATIVAPQALILGILFKATVFIGYLLLIVVIGSFTREEITWLRQRVGVGISAGPGA